MASNSLFIVLGKCSRSPEKTTRVKATLPLVHTKHLLIQRLLQNYYHYIVEKSTEF